MSRILKLLPLSLAPFSFSRARAFARTRRGGGGSRELGSHRRRSRVGLAALGGGLGQGALPRRPSRHRAQPQASGKDLQPMIIASRSRSRWCSSASSSRTGPEPAKIAP
jgi:hypothetical protein